MTLGPGGSGAGMSPGLGTASEAGRGRRGPGARRQCTGSGEGQPEAHRRAGVPSLPGTAAPSRPPELADPDPGRGGGDAGPPTAQAHLSAPAAARGMRAASSAPSRGWPLPARWDAGSPGEWVAVRREPEGHGWDRVAERARLRRRGARCGAAGAGPLHTGPCVGTRAPPRPLSTRRAGCERCSREAESVGAASVPRLLPARSHLPAQDPPSLSRCHSRSSGFNCWLATWVKGAAGP